MEEIQAPKWLNTTVKLSELKPYKHNPRSITRDEVARLSDSIKTTGYHDVILIDRNSCTMR